MAGCSGRFPELARPRRMIAPSPRTSLNAPEIAVLSPPSALTFAKVGSKGAPVALESGSTQSADGLEPVDPPTHALHQTPMRCHFVIGGTSSLAPGLSAPRRQVSGGDNAAESRLTSSTDDWTDFAAIGPRAQNREPKALCRIEVSVPPARRCASAARRPASSCPPG